MGILVYYLVKYLIKRNYKDNSDILNKKFDELYEDNPLFKKIVNSLDVEKSKLVNNTSKIMDSVNELERCMKCKNILECKNEVKGYVYYPSIENDDIVLATRGDAEAVLDAMNDIINQYGTVSVSDLYDLTNYPNDNFSMNRYGWTSINGATPVRVRDGYILKLPKAIPLN